MQRLFCWFNLIKKTLKGDEIVSFDWLNVILSYEQAKAIANKVDKIDRAQNEKELSSVIVNLPEFVVSEQQLPKEGVFIRCELTCPTTAIDPNTRKLKVVDEGVTIWF